jgi:hypothetical protein
MLPPAGINSVGILSISDDLYHLNFSIAISTSKELGSGTNGPAVCILV